MVVKIIIVYVAVSVIVGIVDLMKAAEQERYLGTFPIGDIGYYVFPKKIFGVHNWIFLPSWVVIKVWMLIVRLINNHLDR